MTEANITAFHDSFSRCMAAGRFFDVFYDVFLRSSPEVAAKFQGTNFRRQKTHLAASLYLMVGALVLHSSDYSSLTNVAARHSRGERDIPPHLYGFWLESLIVAARTCDPQFDAAIEANWREAFLPGIDYLVSLY